MRGPVACGLVSLALVAASANGALAGRTATHTFAASYSGTVTEKVNGSSIAASVRGKGTANLLGKGVVAGAVVADTSNSSQTGCAPFSGPGTLTGTKGKLNVKALATSRGCAVSQEDQDSITLSGTAQVVGGTGKFRKARGKLHFSGHYDRKGGGFTVKLSGSLTY